MIVKRTGLFLTARTGERQTRYRYMFADRGLPAAVGERGKRQTRRNSRQVNQPYHASRADFMFSRRAVLVSADSKTIGSKKSPNSDDLDDFIPNKLVR